jgi:hypothetical protein
VSESKEAQTADCDPAEVELAAESEAWRVLGGVVVAMPTFTDGQPRDDGHVPRVSASGLADGARMAVTVDDASREQVTREVQSRGDQTGCDPDAHADPSAHERVADQPHRGTRDRDADEHSDFSVVEEPAVPAIRGEVAVLLCEVRVTRRPRVQCRDRNGSPSRAMACGSGCMSSAFVAKAALGLWSIDQPTTRRE